VISSACFVSGIVRSHFCRLLQRLVLKASPSREVVGRIDWRYALRGVFTTVPFEARRPPEDTPFEFGRSYCYTILPNVLLESYYALGGWCRPSFSSGREILDISPQREDKPAPRDLSREVRGIDGEAEVPLGGGWAGDTDNPLQEVLPLLDNRVLLVESEGFAAHGHRAVRTSKQGPRAICRGTTASTRKYNASKATPSPSPLAGVGRDTKAAISLVRRLSGVGEGRSEEKYRSVIGSPTCGCWRG